MPTPCNIRIPECPGSSEKEGREDTSDVYEIDHDIMASFNPMTGQREGDAIHGPVKVVKQLDRASPLLCMALCKGTKLKEVTIDFYRIDLDTRQEVKYYRITLKNVRISNIRPYVPNTLVMANERLHHMEQVCFVYEEIEWEWVPDGVVASYRWNPAAASGGGGSGGGGS